MTDEEAENSIEEYKHIADSLGMVDYEHFLAFKNNAACGLQMFGNRFEAALGVALYEASSNDAVKIIRVWLNECTQAEMMFKIHMAKKAALDAESTL